jgi:hypothetical protein
MTFLYGIGRNRGFKALSLSLLALFSALWTSCGSNERVNNTGALAAEIRAKQIKRISPSDVAQALREAGEVIAASANAAITKDSILTANCLPSSLPAAVRAKICLLIAKDTSNSELHPVEIDLLKAYYYQSNQSSATLSDHLQAINDTLTIYYAPLPLTSRVFSECETLSSSSFAVLRIALDRREVIKNIR